MKIDSKVKFLYLSWKYGKDTKRRKIELKAKFQEFAFQFSLLDIMIKFTQKSNFIC